MRTFGSAQARFAALMRLEPVFAESDASDEWNFKFHCTFHFGLDHLRERFDLIAGTFENEFVVHLEHHAEREVLVVDALLDANHRYLDEVGWNYEGIGWYGE